MSDWALLMIYKHVQFSMHSKHEAQQRFDVQTGCGCNLVGVDFCTRLWNTSKTTCCLFVVARILYKQLGKEKQIIYIYIYTERKGRPVAPIPATPWSHFSIYGKARRPSHRLIRNCANHKRTTYNLTTPLNTLRLCTHNIIIISLFCFLNCFFCVFAWFF